MHIRTTTTAIVPFVLAASMATNAGAPPSLAEPAPATSTSATVASAQLIVFHDANRKPISSDAFTTATKHGQRYTTKRDPHTSQFIMTLLPPGVNTPGSMSLADAGVTLLLINGVHYEVVFHDVHGKTIDQKTFTAGASRHQRYTSSLDKKSDKAILTLLPIGVDKHGSQLASDWVVTSPQDMAPVPKLGTRFTGFDLPEVSGGSIDAAKLKGKPYIVDFFFAECIGCIAELPVLNAYHKQYPGHRVFALTYDDAETAAGFVKQRDFDWPVAYGGKAFIDKLGIKVYPTMVLVGADGKVLATRIGADTDLTSAKLEQWVVNNLDGKHVPSTTQ